MKISKSILALSLFVTVIAFSSCSQDEPMDEIMSKTEINAPTDPSTDGTTGGTSENDPGNP